MASELKETASLAAEIGEMRRRVVEEVGKVAIGMERRVDLLLTALLARGHVLFEGVPGVAKTLLAKSVATALGCSFRRIQFTPDLLPADITGSSVFDRNRAEFVFQRGPIFAEIVLADEVNRAPAKTQSALLEAMQEGTVTVDGVTHALDDPFLVIATQNPVEQEGVYRLPEAQLDRFFLRVEFGYPETSEEIEILRRHSREVEELRAVTNAESIRGWRKHLQNVQVAPEVLRSIAELARASRVHPDLFLGMSPRASLCLLLASQAWALLQGRAYVTHDDVKRVAAPVLNHRVFLKAEAELSGRDTASVISELISRMRTVE